MSRIIVLLSLVAFGTPQSDVLTVILPNDKEGVCPDDARWHYLDGYCYTFVGAPNQATWFGAELDCRNRLGGSLVSVRNDSEVALLNGLSNCQGNLWIGLVLKLYTPREIWAWWDEGDQSVKPPANSRAAGYDCAMFQSPGGAFASTYCAGSVQNYVCKREAQEKHGDRPKSECLSGWSRYRGSCYYFSNVTANYFHAQLQCEELDKESRVATVESFNEHQYLQMVHGCSAPMRYWIGLEKTNPTMTGSSHDSWTWIDRSPVNYTNWASGYPAANTVECTHSAGYWLNSLACSEKLRFVCKRKIT